MHSAEASALCGGKRDGMRHKRLPARPICRAQTSRADLDCYCGTLLVALGLGSIEAVHHCCLGDPQREPILYFSLEAHVELRYQLFLFLRDVFLAGKFQLEGELAHQRLVLATSAPQTDVALAHESFTEIQLAERQQDFLNNASIDQADTFVHLVL